MSSCAARPPARLPSSTRPCRRSRLDVAVDAVEADVELAAEVPLRVRRLPLESSSNGSNHVTRVAALRLPELLEVALVDVGLGVRLRARTRGRARTAAPRGSIVSIAVLRRHGLFEVVRVVREHLVAVLGDEDEVLEAQPAVARAVQARLDRDDVAGNQVVADAAQARQPRAPRARRRGRGRGRSRPRAPRPAPCCSCVL